MYWESNPGLQHERTLTHWATQLPAYSGTQRDDQCVRVILCWVSNITATSQQLVKTKMDPKLSAWTIQDVGCHPHHPTEQPPTVIVDHRTGKRAHNHHGNIFRVKGYLIPCMPTSHTLVVSNEAQPVRSAAEMHYCPIRFNLLQDGTAIQSTMPYQKYSWITQCPNAFFIINVLQMN